MAVNSPPNRKSVKSATTTAPPSVPATNDAYIVPSSATGAWSGQTDKIAVYNGSSWDFFTPNKDTDLWAEDTGVRYNYNVGGSVFRSTSPNSGSLTVKEVDGSPSVTNVTEIKVTNGTLTDNGGGSVSITTGGGGGGGISTTEDTSANIPSAGNTGNLFYPSDGISIARDNGSAWKYWGPIYKITPPASGSFTWVNQGSATVTNFSGGMNISIPTSSGENVRLLKKTLAASSNYTVICGIIPNLQGSFYKNCGLMVRESSSGKLIGLSYAIASTTASVQVYQWTNTTTFSSSAANIALFPGLPLWLKITDDGTNRKYFVGNTKLDFVEIYSASRTTFCTPDEVGMFVNQVATDVTSSCTFISFEES